LDIVSFRWPPATAKSRNCMWASPIKCPAKWRNSLSNAQAEICTAPPLMMLKTTAKRVERLSIKTVHDKAPKHHSSIARRARERKHENCIRICASAQEESHPQNRLHTTHALEKRRQNTKHAAPLVRFGALIDSTPTHTQAESI
jgi:hypothetical protein